VCAQGAHHTTGTPSDRIGDRQCTSRLEISDERVIPETKAGRSHLLPLSRTAASILAKLSSRASSEWVFPGKGSTGHLVEPKTAWQRIRKAAGVPDVRIHDLRRTLGSWLAGQGYSLQLIGRTLNHTDVSTTQIYARLDLEPVRSALEKTANLMFGEIITDLAKRERTQSETKGTKTEEK
jgi:integrase